MVRTNLGVVAREVREREREFRITIVFQMSHVLCFEPFDAPSPFLVSLCEPNWALDDAATPLAKFVNRQTAILIPRLHIVSSKSELFDRPRTPTDQATSANKNNEIVVLAISSDSLYKIV